MELTLAQIGQILGIQITSNSNFVVDELTSFDCQGNNAIGFIRSNKFLEQAKQSKVAVFVTYANAQVENKINLISTDPERDFIKLTHIFYPKEEITEHFIHPSAVIEKTAIVQSPCHIGAFVYIGEKTFIGSGTKIYANASINDHCRIGEQSLIYSNASVGSQTQIGKRAVINQNASIGGEGFGFIKRDNQNIKIPQVGNVIIGDDFDLGANSCVDRARFSTTRIGNGVKIDNQVQIAHNCQIDDNCIIVSGALIAGGTKVGANTSISGNCSIIDNIEIGENVNVFAHTLVTKDLPANQSYAGIPAQESKSWLKSVLFMKKFIAKNR